MKICLSTALDTDEIDLIAHGFPNGSKLFFYGSLCPYYRYGKLVKDTKKKKKKKKKRNSDGYLFALDSDLC